MKKFLLALSLVFVAVLLVACDTTTTTSTTAAPVAVEFPVDGEFTAYSVTVSSNKPQVTMVTVTIEGGEITDIFIDCRQGTRTNNGTTEAPNYVFAWNAQTKKQLGYGYKMFYNSQYVPTLADPQTATLEGYQAWMEGQTVYKEWFQQAELIEAYLLENGVDSAMTTKAGKFSNVAGVTVSNSEYTKLAQEAVDLARMGKFQTFVCSGTDFYFASMIINNLGQVTNLKLDTLQATKDAVAGTFVWNGFSKQELGDNYGMKGVGAAYVYASGAWTASETAKTSLEWHEQADLITNWVMANGNNANLQSIADRGVSLNGTTLVDGLAGVTIKTNTYLQLIDQLYAAWGN
ncbi:MAG TPA: hypothetical protein P5154_03125 [Candidatus Izemoplasmatales bacterium]|nr:hypothetical protein [Bacillota bacterium]HRY77735.1 hypothetical protein [Candidatus Izemoplasmatales bacterium]